MNETSGTERTSADTRHTTAVVGIGAIGRAVGTVLLRNERPVTVWNRTPEACDPLVELGAIRATDVTEALTASDLVLVSLTDYEAAEQVLRSPGGAAPDRHDTTTTMGLTAILDEGLLGRPNSD